MNDRGEWHPLPVPLPAPLSALRSPLRSPLRCGLCCTRAAQSTPRCCSSHRTPPARLLPRQHTAGVATHRATPRSITTHRRPLHARSLHTVSRASDHTVSRATPVSLLCPPASLLAEVQLFLRALPRGILAQVIGRRLRSRARNLECEQLRVAHELDRLRVERGAGELDGLCVRLGAWASCTGSQPENAQLVEGGRQWAGAASDSPGGSAAAHARPSFASRPHQLCRLPSSSNGGRHCSTRSSVDLVCSGVVV